MIDFKNYEYFNKLTEKEWNFYNRRIAHKNTDNDFYGFGINTCKRENKYWLCYTTIHHGGYDVINEITEKEYMDVWEGRASFTDLREQYPEKPGDMLRSQKIEECWKKNGEPW